MIKEHYSSKKYLREPPERLKNARSTIDLKYNDKELFKINRKIDKTHLFTRKSFNTELRVENNQCFEGSTVELINNLKLIMRVKNARKE